MEIFRALVTHASVDFNASPNIRSLFRCVAVSCIEKGGAGIHRSRDKREAFTTRRHAIKEPRRAPAESRKLFSKSTNADISCSLDPMFAE
jgi:hypothetical protein